MSESSDPASSGTRWDPHERLVKVRVRFRSELGGPDSESLWAEPVDADGFGGTYRLAGTGFVATLAVDDLVRAARDRDGLLRLVDVVQPADRCVTGLMIEGPTVSREATNLLVAQLHAHGAEVSESAGAGFVVSTWIEGMSEERVRAAVPLAVASVPGQDDVLVTLVDCFGPADRTRERLDDIDFEPDDELWPPRSTTSWGNVGSPA
jgi:hypothetical protein